MLNFTSPSFFSSTIDLRSLIGTQVMITTSTPLGCAQTWRTNFPKVEREIDFSKLEIVLTQEERDVIYGYEDLQDEKRISKALLCQALEDLLHIINTKGNLFMQKLSKEQRELVAYHEDFLSDVAEGKVKRVQAEKAATIIGELITLIEEISDY